jgi:iron complex outermembrane receptor protein
VDEIYETSALFTREFQFLAPQTSMTYEGGLDWRQGRVSTHAALFLIDTDNEIHLDPYTTGIGNTNLPPTRRSGLELELRWSPTAVVDLRVAYTYIDARFLEGTLPGDPFTLTNVDIAGKTVPLVPRNKLNVDAAWAITPLLRVSGTVTFVSSQFMENDEGNTFGTQIPPYTVTDLKLVFTPGSWRLSAAVNNVFNEKYYTYAIRSQFVPDRYNAYPLPERTFWIGAEYTFR